MKKIRPEILAPAGNEAAMQAAVAAGADAIYFGLEKHNARERAGNFSLEHLPETMASLHLRGVKGYVTFNTLLYESELNEAEIMLQRIAESNADAVIVQDLGIATLAQSICPALPVHASTQMTITDAHSAEIARSLGVKRGILARELSTAEIAVLAAQTPLELEVFVHGALCVAYSGQCFTSAAWGGRSANRGECAQACRLPYQLLVDDILRDLGEMKYLLSPLDLMGIDALPDLTKAGVVSFKIEGRLKSPEYVAATTLLYRKALDQVLSEKERQMLSQVYSRGASSGFLSGTNHQTVLDGTFPRHRGVFLGVVKGHDIENQLLEVDMHETVRINDGLLFTHAALDPQDKEGPGGRVRALTRFSGHQKDEGLGRGTLEIERLRFDVEAIPVGAKIFRTHDPRVEQQLHQIIHSDQGNRSPVDLKVSGQLGVPLNLEMSDDQGHCVKVTSQSKLVPAKDQSLDQAIVKEKLGRLGASVYVLGALELDLPQGLYLPVKELNDMRRRATESLDLLRMQIPPDRRATAGFVSQWLTEKPLVPLPNQNSLVVPLCRNLAHLNAALSVDGVSDVILDFMDMVGLKKAVLLAREHKKRVVIAPPRISKPGEEKILEVILALNPDEILVRSLGQLKLIPEKSSVLLRGDFSLNAANSITAKILRKRGLKTLVPSYDLSLDELKKFFEDFPPAWCELVCHQYIPMFHTEYCAYAKLLSPSLGFAGNNYQDCGRPCDSHQVALLDRENKKHPIVVDVGCRNTVFSAEANSIADDILNFQTLGVRRFRIELLKENVDEARELIGDYQKILTGEMQGATVRQKSRASHRLGVIKI